MLVFLVFFVAGGALANFFPALKFSAFALAVSVLYFVYLAFTHAGLQTGALSAAGGFVCIQLGYVCGIAAKTAYAQRSSSRAAPFPPIREEEKSKIK